MILDYGIDYSNPVNRAHPLNRGLVAWWLPLPWYRSGPRLIDIAGRYHGTLTNGPTWTSGYGGFAGLNFDGSDDVVTASSLAGGLTAMTLEVVMAGGSGGSTAGMWVGSNTAYNGGFFMGRDNNDCQFWVDTQKYSTITTGAPEVIDGVWRIWHATFEASTRVKIAANGTVYLNSTTSVPASVPSHSGVEIGRNITTALPYAGAIGSVGVFNRVLSDSELFGRYDQWRRGFPDALRRVSTRVVSVPAAAQQATYEDIYVECTDTAFVGW